MSENLLLNGYVFKSLPEGFKSYDDGLWAYATVEVQDLQKDIVRVKGISLERHTPESPIKILINHKKEPFPDGTPSVVGRVEEFRETVCKSFTGETPALAFRMSWAKDGEGKVTELASKYKSLYEGGYLDSFSIGFHPRSAKPIRGGGHDITSSILFEITACTIPINPSATTIKAIKDALGEEVEVPFDASIGAGLIGGLQKDVASLSNTITQLIERFDKTDSLLNSTLKALRDRDDLLESLVVKSHGGAQPTDDPHAQVHKSIKEAEALLSQISSSLLKH